ncbi:MAG TPA: transcription-repair coupling factor [Acholeplasmataceae bacterium]|nr:transcription-repair coupling factor [Acholeplasmataceae bacterium]
MKNIKKYINEKLNQGNKHFKNSNNDFNAYLITEYFYMKNTTVFVVFPHLHEAQKMYDLLGTINNTDDILFYPNDPLVSKVVSLSSEEFSNERLYTIDKLISGNNYIVVTTYEALEIQQMALEKHLSSRITIKINDDYNVNELIDTLTNIGYKREYTVEKNGDFSVRGGIIDVFPRGSINPYRLDFFGNNVESIKLFDVDNQRSFKTVESVEITPFSELFFKNSELAEATNKIKNYYQKEELEKSDIDRLYLDLEELENRINISTKTKYIEFFNNTKTNILNYSDHKNVITINMHETETTPTYDASIDNNGIYLENANDLMVYSPSSYDGELDLFYYDYLNIYQDYQINIAINNKKYLSTIVDYFNDKNIDVFSNNKIKISNDIKGSFYLPNIKKLYLDDQVLFNAKAKRMVRYRSVLNKSTKIREISELNEGDYVVHYDFGIGKYLGLKTMELSGQKRDYLHIVYKDNEALYVPMEQIELVLKYSSYDGIVPPISKMGGRAWKNTKTSVKKKIKDFSDQLLKLYAEREQAEGFIFKRFPELENEFALDFEFEETIDQNVAIENVLKDMEKSSPMDRVIIGDVGFGKTEVAMRAAFRAILNNKQVLYLVPTTVLARQHYYSFKERFEKFGATVELMSRFVTNKSQNETIKRLKAGFVDIVIGTHRLLSNDIKFKDLGLLIIDEEQRFGVLHKERIKEIKINVDTLTLTATPIPRTLQMSIMGIKDLSRIETPPLNRYPIQTYVIPRDDAIVQEAIRREMARGGQTFYLFNRVTGMEGMVHRLKKLIPEASIVYAHGKMNKNELEDTLNDFIEDRNDVLVATTIIETGIDIPNTNTIIIHDADKLGLSQLYQVRGRVGRSDRIAYAYLTFESNKILKDESQKRLKALEEFTALGSGYKIAMRDLAIRGAGDILGKEQSGFIDSVGMELYTKLLEEVLYNKEAPKVVAEDDIYTKRHIDPNYIEKDSVRIEIHKKVSSLNTMSDCEDLKIELEDRFGKVDLDLILYMYEKLFKKLSNKIGVKKVSHKKDEVKLIISADKSQLIDGNKLFLLANTFKYPIRLGYLREEIQITFNLSDASEHWLYLTAIFLDKYVNNATTNEKNYFKTI